MAPKNVRAAERRAAAADAQRSEPRGTPGSGRADYDGTMNAGYVFLGLVLVLAVLWVGGYIKVGGVLSLYRRIRLAALLAVVALIAIAATRIFGLA